MTLHREACYRALRTRDARFDGRFFTAVRSTGVYCRPICPAPTPKLENCLFLPSAAAAQELGYRPCLRCRPEASPGTPAWTGSEAVVSRALRLIAEGALDESRVETLADRLGVSERHLRRVFRRRLGAPPATVARTQRIQFAKRLIDETRLPMTEVAAAAGFSSVRRFNEAIRTTYNRSPCALRRGMTREVGDGLALRLAFRPPFRWDTLVRYLAPRALPGVESVSSEAYRRSLRVGDARGWVEVRPVVGANHLLAQLHLDDCSALLRVVERLRRIFDLGADPREIARLLRRDARLGPVVERLPGLRVPGCWDGFELAVRAILGQQVTVKGATTLAGRLVEAFGERLQDTSGPAPPDGIRFFFPAPGVLADADLTRIGVTRSRAAAIATLARSLACGTLVLDGSLDLDDTVDQLSGLPEIGPWTAQYIAMRALGEPDAFPAGDLGLRRAACEGNGGRLTSAELERVAEAWRPWRAYAAMYLWVGDAASRQPMRDCP